MSAIVSAERHSTENAQAIMARLSGYSFDDLHPLFQEGKTPSFEEIEGDTAGSIFAWNPKTSWRMKLLTRILFDSPFARWTGKRFVTRFDEDERGKGINLYQNRILRHRFSFDTCIKKSMFDQNPCLALVYAPFPSPTFGTIDELRRIEDGVFLGQGYHKFPWEREHSLLGYFVLCALRG